MVWIVLLATKWKFVKINLSCEVQRKSWCCQRKLFLKFFVKSLFFTENRVLVHIFNCSCSLFFLKRHANSFLSFWHTVVAYVYLDVRIICCCCSCFFIIIFFSLVSFRQSLCPIAYYTPCASVFHIGNTVGLWLREANFSTRKRALWYVVLSHSTQYTVGTLVRFVFDVTIVRKAELCDKAHMHTIFSHTVYAVEAKSNFHPSYSPCCVKWTPPLVWK